MPIVKGLPPYAKKTEATKEARPRLQIVEEILMLTAPKWNGKKFRPTMTLKEACDKVGISDMTLRTWRQENPKVGKYFNDVKASRKEMLHQMISSAALENVMEAIGGGVKLRPLDKANLSMRYLEKTDPDMNPALKIEAPEIATMSMSADEMRKRAIELATTLGITNLDNYARTINTPTSSPDDNEEPTGDGEGESTIPMKGESVISEGEGTSVS